MFHCCGGAASGEDSVPVLDWLIEVAFPIVEPIAFHGGNVNPGAAIQTGWLALRAVMRSWGVEAREGLSLWLQSHGFAATTPGNHTSARAQEAVINEACAVDAQVALLERLFT